MSEVPPEHTSSVAQTPSARLVATLGGIAMLSGLLVVLTFQLTLPRIEENKRLALEKAIFEVLPEATSKQSFRLDEAGLTLLPADAAEGANVFAGYNAEGQLTGLAMEAAARGYQDTVRILYGYVPQTECVVSFTVLESRETPGLGDKVETDPAFLANFNCLEAKLNESKDAVAHPIVTVKNGQKTQPWEIDGISGATVTSVAIGNALRSSTIQMLPLLAEHMDSLPLQAPTESAER